jgi:hypothetical protein
LANVDHVVITDWANDHTRTVTTTGGGAPATPPTNASIWTAHASGTGTQTLAWRPTSGNWVVVVMNADGSAGVSVIADGGATVPDLGWIAAGLIVVGVILLGSAVALIAVPVARAR